MKWFCLLFLLLTALPAIAEPLTIVQWSDIHYGNEEYKPDAWSTAWTQGVAKHPDMAVFSGDQVDNKCTPEVFAKRRTDFLGDVATKLAQAHLNAIFCLGNNDVSDNYQSNPEVLGPTVQAYRTAFGSDFYLNDLGNGAYPLDVGGCHWISLNTVIFSPKNHYGGRAAQAKQTLDWLESQVKTCPPQQTLILVMHVPPVRDVLDQKLAWHVDEEARFDAILSKHPGPICILAGHFHRNEIHALLLEHDRTIPVLLAGSLSGKFGCVPNWRLYHYNTDAIQYMVFYPGHSNWDNRYVVQNDIGFYRAMTLTDDYMQDFYAHNEPKDLLREQAKAEVVEQAPQAGAAVP